MYVQVGDGPHDPEANKWSNATLVLNGRDLKLKSYFSPAGLSAAPAKNTGMNAVTPVVFTWRGTEMIAASGKGWAAVSARCQVRGGSRPPHSARAYTAAFRGRCAGPRPLGRTRHLGG